MVKTIVLETPFVSGYAELAPEIDRLVNAELANHPNVSLLGVNLAQRGSVNGASGIWTIFVHVISV